MTHGKFVKVPLVGMDSEADDAKISLAGIDNGMGSAPGSVTDSVKGNVKVLRVGMDNAAHKQCKPDTRTARESKRHCPRSA
jgi:hypothetical protein